MAQKTNVSSAPESSLKDRLQEPENYKVILYNDDYTTKDFVVSILKEIFKKTADEAVVLMETIHRSGKASAGIYCYDIAATKVAQVKHYARTNGFPLNCGMEKA